MNLIFIYFKFVSFYFIKFNKKKKILIKNVNQRSENKNWNFFPKKENAQILFVETKIHYSFLFEDCGKCIIK